MKHMFSAVLAISLFSCKESKIEKTAIVKTENKQNTKKGIDITINKEQANRKCDIENEVSSLGIGVVIAPVKLAIYNDSLLSGKPVLIDMYAQSETLTSNPFSKTPLPGCQFH